MEPTTYILTTGEYEDYTIITATTDKNLAENIQKRLEKDFHREIRIEKYASPEIFLKNLYWFRFDDDGKLVDHKREKTFFSYDLAGQCIKRYKYTAVYVAADSLEKAFDMAKKQYKEFIDKSKEEG